MGIGVVGGEVEVGWHGRIVKDSADSMYAACSIWLVTGRIAKMPQGE